MVGRFLVWERQNGRRSGLAIEATSHKQAKAFYAECSGQPLYEINAIVLPPEHTGTVFSAISVTGLA